ncbi:MAG TPA: 2-hydroxychromene-2-carboxylate isomerase [Myxococcota bacterium]|nr:2-hydroxychromene-2-carboxylate isomerase [Myxococcota bacterium]
MPSPIEFWFDFSSGYAYLAAQEIDALGARVSRPILWRPYMLGTAFKVTGMRGLSSTPMKGDYARHDWARAARKLGVPFAPPADHPKIALPATRAFYWLEANAAGKAEPFAREVFRRYYAGRVDTSDPDAVAALAGSVGLDAATLRAGLELPEIKARARDLSESAVQRGIFGSPFFIVDGEAFWGWDRLAMLEEWIRTGGW